ncbi:MAG: hypothetical protein ACD_22C00230G0004 [uncultured bacterium]|nr:MAG: hypothetical protein ACD_22C00230G0004 [uncultured bacterium]
MLEQKLIKEHLQRFVCYKCGGSLEQAKLMTISDAPVAFVVAAVCPKCQSESVLTITAAGSGAMPLISDLSAEEIKKFMIEKSVTYDDLFSLHKLLEKKAIWNLLHKKEKNLENK